VEGDGHGTLREGFGLRKLARVEIQQVAIKGLQVDAGEVVCRADAVFTQIGDDGIAIRDSEMIGQTQGKDEPGHAGVLRNLNGRGEGVAAEACEVVLSDGIAGGEDVVQPFHLTDTEGGVEFAEAEVKAEAFVSEP